MQKDIFDYYAARNASFLHGRGAGGTEHLLSVVDFKGTERVLEVGFGTGSTLVLVKQRFAGLDLYGLERSEIMLDKAKSRLNLAGHPIEKLSLYDEETLFPFENEYFDIVYLESVLSILRIEETIQIVKEIFRVLKPGGVFAMNETTWLPHFSNLEIQEINEKCYKHLGKIQASPDLATAEKWKSFIESNGFVVDRYEPTLRAERRFALNLPELMSYLFTIYGRFASMCNPQHHQTRSVINKLGKELRIYGKSYLQSYIFRMRKNSDGI